jgi:hypothetical protein
MRWTTESLPTPEGPDMTINSGSGLRSSNDVDMGLLYQRKFRFLPTSGLILFVAVDAALFACLVIPV